MNDLQKTQPSAEDILLSKSQISDQIGVQPTPTPVQEPVIPANEPLVNPLSVNPSPAKVKISKPMVYALIGGAVVIMAGIVVLVLSNNQGANRPLTSTSSSTTTQQNLNNTTTTTNNANTTTPQVTNPVTTMTETMIWVQDKDSTDTLPTNLYARYKGNLKLLRSFQYDDYSISDLGVIDEDTVYYVVNETESQNSGGIFTYNLATNQEQLASSFSRPMISVAAISKDKFYVHYIEYAPTTKGKVDYISSGAPTMNLVSYDLPQQGRGIGALDSFKIALSPDKRHLYTINTFGENSDTTNTNCVKIYSIGASGGWNFINLVKSITHSTLPMWLDNDRLIVFDLTDASEGPAIYTISLDVKEPIAGLNSYVHNYSYNPVKNTLLFTQADDVDQGIGLSEYDFDTHMVGSVINTDAIGIYAGADSVMVLVANWDLDIADGGFSTDRYYFHKLSDGTKTPETEMMILDVSTAYDAAGMILN